MFAAALAGAAHAQGAAGGSSMGNYLVTAFSGGLLSLLTPCVFPMIPVTISYFVKRQGSRAFLSAGSYAFGIISTFAVIGVGTALVFGATGLSGFASNPWFNLALGVLFVVLALSLFGLFEIQLPPALTNRLSKNTRKEGLAGPFFMGATFSLTSFTCTAPIVASLLAEAAKGSALRPAAGMAAYGTAFAIPFFLLALFPGAMAKVPKAGNWLNSVKPTLGFIELAAALKFFSNADLAFGTNLIGRPLFFALWAVIFGGLALYLLGVPKRIKSVGNGSRALGVATVALSAFLVMGVGGKNLGELESFAPVFPTAVAEKVEGRIVASTYKEALELAKKNNRPVFIDFTGVNCVNCRYMEKSIFPDASVKKELDSLVNVQLYTDRNTDADKQNQKLQTELAKNNALPTYVLVKPDGTVIEKSEGASRDPKEFVAFLKKATS